MNRDVSSGALLIAGSATGVRVMALHPTAHGLMDPSSGAHLARLNVAVHGLALAAMPMLFLGLLGLWRRLGPSDLGTAGLVAYGWGFVAVMSAAVASGFVAPAVIARIAATDGSTAPDALLLYTGLWNQGFAKVSVVATSVGILLFSVTILRSGRLSRTAGIFGVVAGTLIPLLVFVGHLRLDVHGYGVVIFAQSAWQIWVGAALCRVDRSGQDVSGAAPSPSHR
jgi:hypothetical protein